MSYPSYLIHHGIKGQHWGERKYQYEDGSLTPAGRLRYYGEEKINETKDKISSKIKYYTSDEAKKNRRINKLVKGKIKNYNKYTEEEIREATKRKEAINALKKEKSKDTTIGKTKEYLDSPAGQRFMETVAKTSIEQLGKVASTSANAAITSFIKENGKELFDKMSDRKNWEEKKEITKEKLKEELNKAKAETEKTKTESERTRAEAERARSEAERTRSEAKVAEAEANKRNSETNRTNAETESIKNNEKREQETHNINKQRSQEVYEATKKVREAQNKADIEEAKATEAESKNRRTNALAQRKADQIIAQNNMTNAEIEKNKLEEEKEYRSFRQGFWNDMHTARKSAELASYRAKQARSESEGAKSYAYARALNTLVNKLDGIDLTKNFSKEEIALLMAIINSKK